MFHPEGPSFWELTRQALSSTERGYDLLAPKFDRTPFRTPTVLLDAVRLQLGGPGSFESALDLCCGTGAGLRMLRPLCRERVVGVDFSGGMLDEARRRLAADAGAVRLELVRADVLELEIEAEFDLVTCFGATGHFLRRDQRRFVEVATRALRPGGRFVFVSAEWPPPWSWRLWLCAGFNAAIWLRNFIWRPPFVMYYLSFLLPRARRLFAEHGFELEVHGDLCREYPQARLVTATRGVSDSHSRPPDRPEMNLRA